MVRPAVIASASSSPWNPSRLASTAASVERLRWGHSPPLPFTAISLTTRLFPCSAAVQCRDTELAVLRLELDTVREFVDEAAPLVRVARRLHLVASTLLVVFT